MRALGILGLVTAGALIPVMGMWGLDVLSVREMREPDARAGVLIGGVIQGLKYLGACLALWLGGTGVTRTATSLRAGAATAAATVSPSSLRRE